ncbi:glutamamyl carboxypeptidase putativemetallo-peptidase Clan MH Family M18 [Leptomonas pyrrhocoris]|uniref:Glutamamyl carboxypeptidase putativemetallo-peptidase Clan MH Family M18 n=1 Tax=Leptomonas pyrrhocoris TaxID=157538 RepID=A0A0M9FRQ8_LEPPY|nr:glutamamyl carboxypeptidase putativemetallo-peptidase Clan MH Family M18 [Leptomonas pyrrhocoris]XP_015652955.1 glutamamyl carboxypeptidase putativemetallo-peptidase Clan MH Family M18 [Leptomonas pyrrhocoris]KPA74515.1 glutamamyl carboxypeptidase putativemetallo-peptidase Clan MH Family M18 [Leptomonas pyrrhocoris]KPA74516.1 glutamamyl carboxypeptidase putativemetallo-peptidase Clan MH Family M18 [Leptomonas pyrrhocoris]|eukprot:XP_015652954.1 glutamamyl carboxypeptidase putativemetallo-peptidase Clan MH Family M18 [Leptomonas pyrrhocoris]
MSSYPKDSTAWLAKLVSFNTVSSNSNLPLLDYIKGYLKTFGIESTYIYSPEKTHANLFATLPGSNGATQGGIVMSGHTDVVPVEGQKWDSDPFVVVEKDGKLYGRGTCDMKGFLAVCMTLMPKFMKMKRVKPIHFAFSYSEEVGCVGVQVMTNWLKEKGFKADCCLVGDGGFHVEPVSGSKGIATWKVVVHGKAIHSSMALMNTSCNAIEYAAQIVAKIRKIAVDLRDNGPQDPHYPCPFCSMSVGLIKGGNAVNTVPAECEFTFSVRLMETSVAKRVETEVQEYINREILPAMRKEYAEASVDLKPERISPAFDSPEDSPFVRTVRRILKNYKVQKLSGGTEGGFFQALGMPTIIVGPGGYRGHMANEYTEVAFLKKSEAFTEEIVRRMTTGEGIVEVDARL